MNQAFNKFMHSKITDMDIDYQRIDWNRAIHESWLLCDSPNAAALAQDICDAGHYCYFATQHHRLDAQQHQQLRRQLLTACDHMDLQVLKAHCFYREQAQHRPSADPCLLVDLRQHQQLDINYWQDQILVFRQEAFVFADDRVHALWTLDDDQSSYKRAATISCPRAFHLHELYKESGF